MSTSRRSRASRQVLVFTALSFIGICGAAQAADMTVATAADELTANGQCSLREAIANANANAQTYADCPAGTGDDRIAFASGVGQITLAQGQLVIGNATGNSGDLSIDGSRPGGLSDVVLDGDNASRVLLVGTGSGAAAQLDLSHVRVQNGNDVAGAGLYVYANTTANLSDCVFTGNVAGNNGGAIENEGTLGMDRCSLAGNSTSAAGGGIGGAALYNGGAFAIAHSTLAGNHSAGDAGAIYVGGDAGALKTIDQSTLSGNSADGFGGALRILSSLTVRQSTIAQNSTGAAGNGGGIYAGYVGTIESSAVADNGTGGDCAGLSSPTFRNSLVGDGGCSIVAGSDGNLVDDAKLGALGDNGGGTSTHLPQADSPLIDAVACDAIAGFDNGADQRGIARPQGAACDIGAVERVEPGLFTVQVLFQDYGGGCVAVTGVAGAFTCDTLLDAVAKAQQWHGSSRIAFKSGLAGVNKVNDVLNIATGTNVTIDGDTNGDNKADITLSGRNVHRVLFVDANAGLSLQHIAVTNGYDVAGAGVYIQTGAQVEATDCAFTDNYANNNGGAIENHGDLTVDHCSFTGNSANSANSGTGGGAILNAGTLRITHSTFAGNQAGRCGGALFLTGGDAAPVSIDQSTLYGNQAGAGGAIEIQAATTIRHSTIAGNTDDASNSYTCNDVSHVIDSGGLYVEYATTIQSSVIAGNSGGDCADNFDFVGNGVHPAFADSLVEDGSCNIAAGTGGNLVADPLLGPLADNGGATQTLLPAAASPLVDAVACDAIAGFDNATDQRDVARPQGAACDIGAVERLYDRIFSDGFEGGG